MPEATITIEPRTATPSADDVLTVVGTITVQLGEDTYSCDVSANGWVSATRQHYGADQYTESEAGTTRVEGAQPRAMTASEVRDYCTQLLVDAFVAATPLVKQTAPNLLETGAPPEPEPTDQAAGAPPADQAGPAPQQAEAPPAAAATEGAPPMEGNPPPPAPRM